MAGKEALLTGAVNQLPVFWVVLLIGDDERQQGDGLAGARGHLQDRMTASIEGFYPRASAGGLRWPGRAQRKHDPLFRSHM